MQTPLLFLKFSTCDIPQKVAAISHPIGQIATVSSSSLFFGQLSQHAQNKRQ